MEIDQSRLRNGADRFLRVRVDTEINKPLRRFVTSKLQGAKMKYGEDWGMKDYPFSAIAAISLGIVRQNVIQKIQRREVQKWFSNMKTG